MNIKFLSELALNTLQANLNQYLHFFNEKDHQSLLLALKSAIGEEPLKESNIPFRDGITLDPSPRGGEEVRNIKTIYEELINLPRSIACDGRIWAGLAIDRFWSYTKDRWNFSSALSAEKVEDHFLFKGQSKKAYTRQSIARLWWIGDLTYDENRDDPYEITKFTMQDTDYVVNLLERNFSSNRQIFREFVEAVETARNEGFSVARDEIRQLCKYLNLLGGVYVLDAFPQGLIREKIYNQAIKICGVKK